MSKVNLKLKRICKGEYYEPKTGKYLSFYKGQFTNTWYIFNEDGEPFEWDGFDKLDRAKEYLVSFLKSGTEGDRNRVDRG